MIARLFKFKVVFFSLLLSAQMASAMYAAVFNQSRTTLSTTRPTHFLIAGEGGTLRNLPNEAALTQAYAIKKQFPNDQVILISEFQTNIQALDQFNIWHLELVYFARDGQNTETSIINVNNVTSYMRLFNKIKSFHFFGHTTIHGGPTLMGNNTFGFEDEHLLAYFAPLRPLFTSDAYALFHGCNSGWHFARRMSEILGIPVAGAFTGTKFERLTSTGTFADEGSKSTTYATSNGEFACSRGACVRMKPQDTVYSGHWGRFETPSLNFYKFFCAIKDITKCYSGIVRSVLAYPSPFNQSAEKMTVENYKLLVSDFLCPSTYRRAECFAKLNSHTVNSADRTFHFMNTKFGQLDVNFVNFHGKLDCQTEKVMEGHISRKCTPYGDIRKDVTTFAREYEFYMEAFKALYPEKFMQVSTASPLQLAAVSKPVARQAGLAVRKKILTENEALIVSDGNTTVHENSRLTEQDEKTTTPSRHQDAIDSENF